MTTDSHDLQIDREHLAGCDLCRERLAASEPERLLILLAAERPADREWERALQAVSQSVRRTIHSQPVPLRKSGWKRKAAVWTAVAAGLTLAIIFGTRGSAPVPSGAGPEGNAVFAVGSPTNEPSSDIEWISTPRAEATRYDFVVGNAQVVMIFDQGLEL